MESLALVFSTSGRIAPKAFAIGAIAVYGLNFLSQFLFAAPLLARGGLIGFVAIQTLVTWTWYALHAKRLRDCGRSIGPALAIAILYALSVVLFVLVLAAVTVPLTTEAPGDARSGGIFEFFLIFFLIGLIVGDPHMGVFGYVILAVLAAVTLPFVIAVAFSLWLGFRPRAHLPS
jgi:uncharacterized membrane protein YhaH (DUF805 family)